MGDSSERQRSVSSANSLSSDLLRVLIDLLSVKRDEWRAKYDRVLPVGDYLSDRWDKARVLGFGESASIYDSSVVIGDVRVGEGTWIGPFTVLDGSGGLIIGSYCSISAGVQIYTHDTVEWALSGGGKPAVKAPVTIGDRCYIGPNAVISLGVEIGDGCVIGANSFVNRNLAPGSRAWGNPARIQPT